jgi:hypothetical protein
MAKVIDTRKDGRGLKYTAYDTKLVDYASAPSTGIDPDRKFKIGKPKTLERPGAVTYFGEEFKEEAERLDAARQAAYRRRQTNEYIRTGAAAPGDRVSEATSNVRIGQLRTEGFTAADRAQKQAGRQQKIERNRADLVAKGQQQLTTFATGLTSGNLRTASKAFRSLAGTAAEGLQSFRDKKDDGELG